ncbi:MAG: hypothetical protein LBU04_05925 [Christensenellaceae bacterium]|jgi:hypothetical protein|nr:hypothetical protein [Christensenellaceae bacterium]
MAVESIKPVNVLGLDFSMQKLALTAMATASYPRFYKGCKKNAQTTQVIPLPEKRQ